MPRIFAPLLLLLLLLPCQLLADTTYIYMGNPFTSVSNDPFYAGHPQYRTSDSVTGSFTITGGPLICVTQCSILPASYSFSDGLQEFSWDTSSPSDLFQALLTTDSVGAITGWSVFVYGDLNYGAYQISTQNTGEVIRDYGSHNGAQWFAQNVNSPGVWTVRTPESDSLTFGASGLLATLALVRRRKLAR